MSKANEVLDEFASAVVSFDAESASRAQIEMMQSELHKLGKRLAEAELEVEREHRETDTLRRSYEEYLGAARKLEARLAGVEDETQRTKLESSLSRIITKLERLKPDIEREEKEDQEVETWRAELRHSYEGLAGKLRDANSKLVSARRQMDVAKLRRDRAVEWDRRIGEGAGIAGAVSALNVALDAMNRETNRHRIETDALNLKAGLLSRDQIAEDPNIAAALAEVRKISEIGGGSLSDRLAALDPKPSLRRLPAAE